MSIMSDKFSNTKIKNLISSDHNKLDITRQIFEINYHCESNNDNAMINLLESNTKIKQCTFYLDTPCVDYIFYLFRTNLKAIHSIY
jgi:hypothetical protein